VNGPTNPALEVAIAGFPPTLPLPLWERKSRALEESSPTAAGRFRYRARLYGELDSRLHSKTRFFGAASVTNCVLGDLATIGLASAPANRCAGWLADLGSSLETLNRSIAEAVHLGCLAGPGLNARIVSIEQAVVEQSLQRARASRTSDYFDVLPVLDALLNRGWMPTYHFSPAVRCYRRVLAQVRDELRSPIEFARHQHREKIGMALICELQRERRPSTLFSKLSALAAWPASHRRPHRPRAPPRGSNAEMP
jgi:hypothetical protein